MARLRERWLVGPAPTGGVATRPARVGVAARGWRRAWDLDLSLADPASPGVPVRGSLPRAAVPGYTVSRAQPWARSSPGRAWMRRCAAPRPGPRSSFRWRGSARPGMYSRGLGGMLPADAFREGRGRVSPLQPVPDLRHLWKHLLLHTRFGAAVKPCVTGASGVRGAPQLGAGARRRSVQVPVLRPAPTHWAAPPRLQALRGVCWRTGCSCNAVWT